RHTQAKRNTRTHLQHAAGRTRESRRPDSRGGAYQEILSLQFEQAEGVVEPNNLGILGLLFGGQRAGSTLAGKLFDSRDQIFANCVKRRVEQVKGMLVHVLPHFTEPRSHIPRGVPRYKSSQPPLYSASTLRAMPPLF